MRSLATAQPWPWLSLIRPVLCGCDEGRHITSGRTARAAAAVEAARALGRCRPVASGPPDRADGYRYSDASTDLSGRHPPPTLTVQLMPRISRVRTHTPTASAAAVTRTTATASPCPPRSTLTFRRQSQPCLPPHPRCQRPASPASGQEAGSAPATPRGHSPTRTASTASAPCSAPRSGATTRRPPTSRQANAKPAPSDLDARQRRPSRSLRSTPRNARDTTQRCKPIRTDATARRRKQLSSLFKPPRSEVGQARRSISTPDSTAQSNSVQDLRPVPANPLVAAHRLNLGNVSVK